MTAACSRRFSDFPCPGGRCSHQRQSAAVSPARFWSHRSAEALQGNTCLLSGTNPYAFQTAGASGFFPPLNLFRTEKYFRWPFRQTQAAVPGERTAGCVSQNHPVRPVFCQIKDTFIIIVNDHINVRHDKILIILKLLSQMQRKAQKMPHKFFPQIGTSLLDDRKVYSAVQTACHISHNQKEDQKKKQSLQPGHFKIDCSIYNFRNKKGKAHFQSNRNSRQKHIKHCFSGYCFPDVSCIRIFIYFFWIFVNQHCGLSPSQFTKNLPFSLHYSILYYVNLICNLIIDFIMTDYHNQFFFLSFYTLTLSQNFSLFDHPDCCLVHQEEETDGHRLKFSQERSSAFLPATGFPVL